MLPWPENLIVLFIFISILCGAFLLLALTAEGIEAWQKHRQIRLRIQATVRKAGR